MPPPLPRSRTTSPAWSEASAVGLPQPRDALRASSGIAAASSAVYRSEVIGSAQVPLQQPLSSVAGSDSTTRRARSAYLVRTVSRRLSGVSSVGMDVLPISTRVYLSGSRRGLVQLRAPSQPRSGGAARAPPPTVAARPAHAGWQRNTPTLPHARRSRGPPDAAPSGGA